MARGMRSGRDLTHCDFLWEKSCSCCISDCLNVFPPTKGVMPKQTFRPAARRARRTNPLARPNAQGAPGGSSVQASDVIPLLAKLPLSAPSDTAKALKDRLAELQEQSWALSAISSLAADPALRKQLLQPHHKLVQRILRVLASHPPVPSAIQDESPAAAEAAAIKLTGPHSEVQQEATRTLRNLAIDASYESVRLEIARHEGIPVLLSLLAQSHSALAGRVDPTELDKKPASASASLVVANGKEALQAQIDQERQRLQADLPTPERPLESMNKKQRRHALKAQNILNELEAKAVQVLNQADTAEATPAESKGETELVRRATETLSKDAEQTTELCEMVENLLTLIWLLAEASEALSRQLVEEAPELCHMLCVYLQWVVNKEQGGIAQGSPYEGKLALIARTAGNTLLVLADDNVAFIRLLSGAEYSKEEIKALTKGARGRFVGRSVSAGSGSAKGAAAPGVAVAEAKHAQVLAAPHVSRTEGRKNLSTLLASTRHIPSEPVADDLAMVGVLAAAVLRSTLATLPEPESVQATRPEGGVVTIVEFEQDSILPQLGALLSNVQVDQLAQAPEEAAELVLLALEVVAETVPALARILDEKTEENDWDEAMDEDHVMGDSEEEDGDLIEADVLDDVGPDSIAHQHKGKPGDSDFASSFLAQAFTSSALLPALVRLATPAVATAFATDAGLAGSRLRRVAVHALAALNNLLLALADHSPPPPSQPIESPEQEKHLAQVAAWIDSPSARTRIEELWQGLFATAAQVAGVPSVAASDASTSAGQDGRTMFEHCMGCLWALARLTGGDLPLRLNADGTEVDVSTALQAAYHTASSDAVRVKALGTIGCLARGPHVSDENNLILGAFLVNVVKAVGQGTTAEALVAALNAVMDVYADETRPYDHNYSEAKFSGALRTAFGRVRQATRGIDKRTHASLRATADEAVSNLLAFVQYREQLAHK